MIQNQGEADWAGGSWVPRPTDGTVHRSSLVRAMAEFGGFAGPQNPSLLFLALDHLGAIHASLGRDAGNEIVRQMAARLTEQVAQRGRVARLGEDAFAVLMADPDRSLSDNLHTARELLGAPLSVFGTELQVTGSLGVATFDASSLRTMGTERLLDRALHLVRRAWTFDQEAPIIDLVEPRWSATTDPERAHRLIEAVARREIVVHYQPVMDLRTGRAVGAEALARWPCDGQGGSDAGFVELAASLGLVGAISEQILEQVCADFGSGPLGDSPWWVSMNLGIDDVADPLIPARISAATARYSMDPRRLRIEVSERIVPNPCVARSLAAIATTGVGLAIDDFGSGWSSLAQLRSLPVDVVKIDGSMFGAGDRGDARLLVATVGLARALDLGVIAEGIETEADIMAAECADVQLGQGFYWNPAMPLPDLLGMLPG